MMPDIPNPAKILYGLGLGIGPTLRNIVSASKKPSKTEEAKKEKREIKQEKSLTAVTSLLTTNNKLLKDIHKQLVIGTNVTKNQIGLTTIAGIQTQAPAGTLEPTSIRGESFDLFKTLLTIGGAGALLKLMPEGIKKEVAGIAGDVVENVGSNIVDGLGRVLSSAWETSPVATILGGLLVARITGVLGAATSIAKGTLGTAKGLYQFGKAMSTGPVGAPATISSTTQGPSAVAIKAAEIRANNPSLTPQQALVQARVQTQGVGAQLRLNEARVGTTPATATTAGAVGAAPAAGTSAALKAARIAGKVGLVGTVASLGMAGYDYYKTGKEEEAGIITAEESKVKKSKIVGGTAGGLAAGLYGAGKGALIGSALGPVGTVVGGIVGGVAGSLAGSYLGNELGEMYGRVSNAIKGPSPTSTQLSAGGSIPGIDNGKLLDNVGKLESNNNYGIDNKVGFVGRYGIGSQALETVGLLKPGASEGRTKGSNAAIYDPSAWVNGMSLQRFLEDRQLQDRVASQLMKMNYDQLVKSGVITSGMNEPDIASRLYAAWHGGVGGAIDLYQKGIAREDFHFKGVTTQTSANKMQGLYQTASAGSVSPTNVSSQSSMVSGMFAAQQQAFSDAISTMSGQNVNIDMSSIVNNAMSAGGYQATTSSGPTRSSSPKTNAALDAAKFAVGTG
jgi:hypothetical protein